MEKIWQYKPTPTSETETMQVQNLQKDLGISESMAVMLWQRGISDFDEAKHFFRPDIVDLHDPF